MLYRLFVNILIGICLGFFLVHFTNVFYYKHTYIRTINCPTLSNNIIKNYLDEFNSLGYYIIVKFDKGIRPIDIYEFEPIGKDSNVLGYTINNTYKVTIFLSKNLEDRKIKPVLIHELLHAFGFQHASSNHDLMYPYINNNISYDSEYVKYYEKLRKLIYE